MAVQNDSDTLALVDPLIWADSHTDLRTLPGVAVSLGSGGSDMALLSKIRLDGLLHVIASSEIRNSSDETMARIITRDYYGIRERIEFDEQSSDDTTGLIVSGHDALSSQAYEHVEPFAKAWWIMTGSPWVRALLVGSARVSNEQDAEATAVFSEIATALDRYADTVARDAQRSIGGEEEHWLRLIRAISFRYGPEERSGLRRLLDPAARMRMCVRVQERDLPPA